MPKRETGPDILRCLGLLCVCGVHSFLYNGFYYEPQTGAAMFLADCARWLFFCCNGIFLMLTGYLKGEKPINSSYWRSLASVLLGYSLTCLVSFPIRHFIIGEKLTLWEWAEKFITFGNYGWYVEMYLGLMLLSPMINFTLAAMKTRNQVLVFTCAIIVVTSLGSATDLDLVPDFWSGAYPLAYYTVGAAIHRLKPKISPALCLLGALLTIMLLGSASVLSADQEFSTGFTQGYGGFWIVTIVTFLFLALYRIQLHEKLSAVFRWAAGGCFEGYMLSRLFDVWIYDRVPQWHSPEHYVQIFFCITIPIFLISICLGKIVHWPIRKIMGRKKTSAA